jgi:hypothetical protein
VRREGPLIARPGKPRLVDGASGPIHEWSEGGVALSEGKIVSELARSLGQGFELDRARRAREPRVRQFGERGDGSGIASGVREISPLEVRIRNEQRWGERF